MPQFLRHLINDRIGRVPQPPEQVLEPGVPILEIVQLLRRILVDILPYKAMQPVIVHSGKAPLRQHVPRHVFQQIVQERTDLRRVKGRRFPRLRPQAVVHEIGKMAGADPFQPGSGHGDPLAVNSPDGGRRQAAPPGSRRVLHSVQPPGRIRVLPEVLPEGAVPPLPCRFQCRGKRCKAIFLAGRFPLHLQIREQLPQPLHYKSRTQFAAGDIRHRVAHRQSFGGLGQRRIEILQLHAHPLHAAGGQLNSPESQLLPVVLIQQAAALAGIRQHMVVSAQQKQILCGVPVISGNLADGHLIQ